MLIRRCRSIADSPRFHHAVLTLIVANAILMGFETSAGLMQRHGEALLALNGIIQAIFVAEIAVRLLAYGRRPFEFFLDGWNVFDFVVVALSLLPVAGALANVARLARVLRAARLISALPNLRLIIGTMLRSIPSMGHVVLLLGLLIFVYGVLGVHLFRGVDPEHWGSLSRAAGTLFQILTLEEWVGIQAASREGHPLHWLFYGSFIVVAVFVVINLFIAVVINNLEETRREEERHGTAPFASPGAPWSAGGGAHRERIAALRSEIDALERSLGGGAA